MVKLLAAGGLGDAVMCWAKARTKFTDFSITHLEVPTELLGKIAEFYTSQGVPNSVVNIPSWDSVPTVEYDIEVTCNWESVYAYTPVTWETNPFQDFIIEPTSLVLNDVVIAPYAGRLLNRSFSEEALSRFVDSTKGPVTIIGAGKDIHLPNCTNYINRTTIKDTLALLSGAKVVIGHPGFVIYTAALMGKKVFSTKEPFWEKRFHPKWNVTFIKTLEEAKYIP